MENQTSLVRQDFHFNFPPELVAQQPLSERDCSRMLVRYHDGRISHRVISDLPGLLTPSPLFIVNDSRVLPSRLFGTLPGGGRIEIFLLKDLNSKGQWQAIGRPQRKLKIGTLIKFAHPILGRISELPKASESQQLQPFTIDFETESEAFGQWLAQEGFVPLPPYIHRDQPDRAAVSLDRDRYQCVYATIPGSVAAPTAGLHFSPSLLTQLKVAGADIAMVTLHVGGGTFFPVKVDALADHQMHAERYHVPGRTLDLIRDAQRFGRPIVAVGTTSLRCLESLFLAANKLEANIASLADRWLTTDLFIYPRCRGDRFQPWAVTHLLTNFHQPESTLFMLVAALIGLPEALACYREAFKESYRLFSYGDASLLQVSKGFEAGGPSY